MLSFKLLAYPLFLALCLLELDMNKAVFSENQGNGVAIVTLTSSKQRSSFDLINGLSSRLMSTSLRMFWPWFKALSMFDSAGYLCIEAHCRSVHAKLEGG